MNRAKEIGPVRSISSATSMAAGVASIPCLLAIRWTGVKSGVAGLCIPSPFVPDTLCEELMADLPFREVVQLHGIATDNLPPADFTTNYVNIVTAVVTKMSDRGRYRTSASRPRCA